MGAIETYVQSHLGRQLAAYGLTDRQIGTIAEDVQRRFASLFCRWRDRPFRRAILLLGAEEATFYCPATTDLDRRALVVVAIRNSLIEDLGSTSEAARRLGLAAPVLSDRDVPAITGAAIEYLAGLDLDEVAGEVTAPSEANDVFGRLPKRYPTAWRALSKLALGPQPETRYAPAKAATAPPILLGRPVPDRWLQDTRTHVLSGMDQTIEPRLQRVLRLVKNGVVPAFFADSFKMITRDPDKLLKVIEFVLAQNRTVVTHNYYLSNGYVARRDPLLRPAHTAAEAQEKLGNLSGLSPRHAAALREIRGFL